jgi:hypothetical protein
LHHRSRFEEHSIYQNGEMKPAFPEECQDLEVDAVWKLDHIIDRISDGKESVHLKKSQRTRSSRTMNSSPNVQSRTALADRM